MTRIRINHEEIAARENRRLRFDVPGSTSFKRGRPTKRTIVAEKLILRAVKLGLSDTSAAQLAGMDPATFYRWKVDDADFRGKVEFEKANSRTFVAGHLWRMISFCRHAPTRLAAIRYWLGMRVSEFQEKRRDDEELFDPDENFL